MSMPTLIIAAIAVVIIAVIALTLGKDKQK